MGTDTGKFRIGELQTGKFPAWKPRTRSFKVALPPRQARPAWQDLLLGTGAVALAAAVLLVLGLPGYHRLENRARLAAIRGNAATMQLAAETYAAQNQGRYPAGPSDLIPWLPGKRAPQNPLTGREAEFRAEPGDVTYRSSTGGQDYVIQAWGFGAGPGPQVLLTLTGARR